MKGGGNEAVLAEQVRVDCGLQRRWRSWEKGLHLRNRSWRRDALLLGGAAGWVVQLVSGWVVLRSRDSGMDVFKTPSLPLMGICSVWEAECQAPWELPYRLQSHRAPLIGLNITTWMVRWWQIEQMKPFRPLTPRSIRVGLRRETPQSAGREEAPGRG